MRCRLALVLLTLVLLAGSAAAQEQSRWYGQRLLILDGAFDALVLGGVVVLDESTAETAFYLGALGQLVAGPVVHGMHGNTGRAVASGGIRLAAGGLSWLLAVGAYWCDHEDESCDDNLSLSDGLVVVAPMVAAHLIDDLFIAREKVTYSADGAVALPGITPIPGGAMIGFSGSF